MSARSFEQALAETERHTIWKYSVRGIGELTMVSIEPITRAQAEFTIKMHFGDRLIALRPGRQPVLGGGR
ncbi:MAG: hypothetical protein RIC56_15880 [Pseudomonadales bacterium]